MGFAIASLECFRNMVEVGEKIRRARVHFGFGQEAIDAATGSGRGRTFSYERGRAQPSKAYLNALAIHLGLPVTWFTDGKDTPVPVGTMAPAVVREPTIQYEMAPDVQAGIAVTAAVRSWTGALAGWDDEDQEFAQDDLPVEVPTLFLIGGAEKIDRHDIVRVTGSSMEPRIESGDRVIFYQQPEVAKGRIVLAQSPAGKVYVKAVDRDDAGRPILRSIGHGDRWSDLSGWKILGQAICVMGTGGDGRRNIEWDNGRFLRA